MQDLLRVIKKKVAVQSKYQRSTFEERFFNPKTIKTECSPSL